MLRPGSPWRTGINRVLALGPSRIALVLAVVLVLVALFGLSSPTVALPAAATADCGSVTITGFWGSASTPSPPTGWSWGPGLGWWILLPAVVLGSVGASLPYVKSIRAMIPAPPPGWRPPS